jgi:hypothetical protein
MTGRNYISLAARSYIGLTTNGRHMNLVQINMKHLVRRLGLDRNRSRGSD